MHKIDKVMCGLMTSLRQIPMKHVELSFEK